MKNLNNIRYSLEDAEELTKAFQGDTGRPIVKKLRKSDDQQQKSKGFKRKRNKRYNDTFNKRNI